jgi:adenosylcobinamide-phosphate synthase
VRFLAVIVALLLDYHYPSAWRVRVHALLLRLAQRARALLTAQYAPAWIVWAAVVAGTIFLTLVLSGAAHALSGLLAWVFSVLVLYLVTDFGAVLSRLRRTHTALRRGETEAAQELLALTPAGSAGETSSVMDMDAVASATLQNALTHAHQRGFAPLLWFVLLGPAGAAGYWIGAQLVQRWLPDEALGPVAQQGLKVLDWLPARLTALSFAVVGDFEDALYCWRTQGQAGSIPSARAVASGAGAIGARLNIGATELGLGELPDADTLQSAEGLLWRAAVLWLGALLLLGLAAWIGDR